MYSELKKNIAKSPDATKNITTFAALSERTRKIDKRTSGAFARSSIKTKPARSATATRNVMIVCAEPQPFCSVWTIAYTSAISPPVTVTAPGMSKLRCAASSFDSGTSRSGRDECCAETLERARADQHSRARREPVEQRGSGEDDHAAEEEALASEQVAGA